MNNIPLAQNAPRGSEASAARRHPRTKLGIQDRDHVRVVPEPADAALLDEDQPDPPGLRHGPLDCGHRHVRSAGDGAVAQLGPAHHGDLGGDHVEGGLLGRGEPGDPWGSHDEADHAWRRSTEADDLGREPTRRGVGEAVFGIAFQALVVLVPLQAWSTYKRDRSTSMSIFAIAEESCVRVDPFVYRVVSPGVS